MGKAKPKEQEQTQPSQLQTWDSSGYLARKAKRQETIVPEWMTNPETGERFLIRRLGLMPSYVARNMAALLKQEALSSWIDQGLEIPEADTEESENDKKTREDVITSQRQSERISQLTGKTVVAACVVPKIVLRPARQRGELDIADLDDSDLGFIYRCALGLQAESSVEMQGGETVPLEELKSGAGERRQRFGTIGRG
jgi:hypothetical protein